MSAAPLLELRGIRAAYGPIEVLHGIDLTLRVGQVFALLGPNGGGKSTTLKVCSGLLRATEGEYRLCDRVVNRARPDALARAGLCTIPEGKGIFPNLTVHENLVMMTQAGVELAAIEDATFTRFPQLADRRTQLAGTMSGGEQQMLAMSRALGTDPAVLLLDELSMGLAPLIVRELYEIVARVAESGVSILLVEQFARAVLGIADRGAIMLNGAIVREGEPAELEKDLSAAYLGAGNQQEET